MLSEFAILDELRPIGLDEMDSISLMNRVDSKYLALNRSLMVILEQVRSKGYSVLRINGSRIQKYRTMYYDTPSLQMYLDHHNGRLVRQKLRTRQYVLTGETFVELKSKNNRARTKKKRIPISPFLYQSNALTDPEILTWLSDKLSYHSDCMSPSVETVFSRITIVNPRRTERTTIDFGLHFNNLRTGVSADFGDLAIIEVKQDGNHPSEIRDILMECRIKPVRVSKYCIGVAMTDDSVRKGRFKQKLMLIDKLNTQI